MDMITFACAHCGTTLKIKAALKNTVFNCPKCGKKVSAAGTPPTPSAKTSSDRAVTPGTISTQAAAPAAADEVFEFVTEEELVDSSPPAPPPTVVREPTPPAAQAAPTQPAQKPTPPPPAVAVKSTPPPATPAKHPPPAARAVEYVQDPAIVERLRKLETELELANLKAAQAETARQQAQAAKTEDKAALEKKVEDHFKTELEAAKRTIAEQESKLAAEYRRRVEVEALMKNKRGATEIERDLLKSGASAEDEGEAIDPDAVMAEIKYSRLGKDLRTSLLIHALIMGVTSIGYIITLIRGPQEAPPAEEQAAATAPSGKQEPGGKQSPTDDAKPSPAGETKQAGDQEKSKPPAEAEKQKAPDAAGKTENRDKTAVEKKIEELPAKGESPPKDTTVSLNLE